MTALNCFLPIDMLVAGEQVCYSQRGFPVPVHCFHQSQCQQKVSMKQFAECSPEEEGRMLLDMQADSEPKACRRFPAAIVPGLLYLGGWDAAEDSERLQELNVRR